MEYRGPSVAVATCGQWNFPDGRTRRWSYPKEKGPSRGPPTAITVPRRQSPGS